MAWREIPDPTPDQWRRIEQAFGAPIPEEMASTIWGVRQGFAAIEHTVRSFSKPERMKAHARWLEISNAARTLKEEAWRVSSMLKDCGLRPHSSESVIRRYEALEAKAGEEAQEALEPLGNGPIRPTHARDTFLGLLTREWLENGRSVTITVPTDRDSRQPDDATRDGDGPYIRFLIACSEDALPEPLTGGQVRNFVRSNGEAIEGWAAFATISDD